LPAIWLLAPLPMLAIHFRNMWERPQHQYFPIVLGAVGLLLWTRLIPAKKHELEKKHWTPHLVLAASLLTLTLGTWVVFSPWLAAVAFVLAAGGAMLVLAERYHVENLLGIWVLLWLLVPLPSVYEQQLSQFLQRATTVVSGATLDRVGLPNLVEGTTLVIPGQHLFIEEACTGIVSMMSVIACCLILAVWANRAWLHTILLVLAGLVLVSVTNVLRIVTLAIADVWLDVDLTTGWKHDLLGLCLFGVAIALALSTDRVLHFLLAPVTRAHGDDVQEASWWTRTFNAVANFGTPAGMAVAASGRKIGGPVVWRTSLLVWTILFALLGATSVYAIATRDTSGPDLAEPDFAKALVAESLPAKIEGWAQVGFGDEHRDNLFAQHSKVWSFRQGDLAAIFSFDFSFDQWHRLYNCYSSVGWDRIGPPYLKQAKRGGEAVYLLATFRKADDQHGLLTYSLVDPDGKPFDPPAAVSMLENTRRRLQKGSHTLYQLQLWVTSTRAIESEDRESVQRLFESLRAKLMRKMRGNITGVKD
jgi:exosortase